MLRVGPCKEKRHSQTTQMACSWGGDTWPGGGATRPWRWAQTWLQALSWSFTAGSAPPRPLLPKQPQEDGLCSPGRWKKVQNKRTFPTQGWRRARAGCQPLRKSCNATVPSQRPAGRLGRGRPRPASRSALATSLPAPWTRKSPPWSPRCGNPSHSSIHKLSSFI